jgi:hypothetical protein
MDQYSKMLAMIDGLTSNDDLRQELWVCYLSESSSNLLDRLQHLCDIQRIDSKFQKALWHLAADPSIDKLIVFLKNFSDFEQSIMILLALGLSVEDVAKKKDMSVVRVRQVINAVKSSDAWKQFKIEDK